MNSATRHKWYPRLGLKSLLLLVAAGLEHLIGHSKLTSLGVANSKVTNAGIARFKANLPECRIR